MSDIRVNGYRCTTLACCRWHEPTEPEGRSRTSFAAALGNCWPKSNRASERSKVRPRFSVFHEIAHTLFPGFENHILHRDPGRSAPFDSEAQLESLCDLAASEMLLPQEPFTRDVEGKFSVRRIPSLSRRYGASMEAVSLRMVQLTDEPCLILKLTYRRKRKKPRTRKIVPEGVPDAQKNTRVSYSARSEALRNATVSKYLAVPPDSCIHLAAWGGKVTQGEEPLDLGSGTRTYRVEVLPLRGSSRQPYRPVIALLSAPTKAS